MPWTMRGAPTSSASVVSAVIRATGMPDFSIALAIVAPQREQVAQLDVRIAALTFAR